MINEKAKTILRDCSKEELKHTRIVDYDKFAKEIVGETILAILAADCRDLTKTTYDKGFVDGVTSRIVESVRNHWRFE